MTDDLDSFLDDFCPGLRPKPVEPETPFPEHDDDPLDFLPEEDEPALRCDDPEAQAARILAKVPDADPIYVTELVSKSSPEFIDALLGPMSKRARFVRDLLLRYRRVSTRQIESKYNAVALRELRYYGIEPTFTTIQDSEGRSIRLYELDPQAFVSSLGGRRLSPSAKDRLFLTYNFTCALCFNRFEPRHLFDDHRVPHRIAGDELRKVEGILASQPVCRPCNNEKQGVCRHCPNLIGNKDPAVCRSCYWAYPESYKHIATRHERRLTLVASSPEQMDALAKLEAQARSLGLR